MSGLHYSYKNSTAKDQALINWFVACNPPPSDWLNACPETEKSVVCLMRPYVTHVFVVQKKVNCKISYSNFGDIHLILDPTVTLTHSTSSATVTEGVKVTLTCASTYTKSTTYSFTKGGTAHNTGVSGAVLTITSTAVSDAGIYVCKQSVGSAVYSSVAVTLKGNQKCNFYTLQLCITNTVLSSSL